MGYGFGVRVRIYINESYGCAWGRLCGVWWGLGVRAGSVVLSFVWTKAPCGMPCPVINVCLHIYAPMEQQRVAMACLKDASRKTFLASGSMFHESCVVFDLCLSEEPVGVESTDIQDRTGHQRSCSLHSTNAHTYTPRARPSWWRP